MRSILTLICHKHVLRTVARWIIRRCHLGRYEQRVACGAVDRPHYGYCVYNAGVLAKALGYQRMSVLEFGVAGGNGLLNLEYHAREVAQLLGIDIEIFGFDTGEGLPQPVDYRDLPYHWKKGFFKLDVPKLQVQLTKAKLILGTIEKTSATFFDAHDPAPIGAIVYDFDLYSSTVVALKMLKAAERYYLPRVFCYFDDTVGTEVELFNDYTGERLAINEFNRSHDKIKLGVPYHLLAGTCVEPWYRQTWICHFFEHSRYNDFVSEENQQRLLQDR